MKIHPKGCNCEAVCKPVEPTVAQMRIILSHVYCVDCLPQDDGWVYPWAPGAGEPLCCRCACRQVPDLRLYVATERRAREAIAQEKAAGCYL